MILTSEAEARTYVAARCDRPAMEKLELFIERLRVENTQQNLVSSASLEQVWVRHIADSAQLLDYAPKSLAGPWLVLGRGAGFPGLVIAILRPELSVTMVESRRLRIDWLSSIVQNLDLIRCNIAGARLEAVPTAPFSVISARAFAPLDKLVALANRFSTSDTVWLLPKGRSAAQEVSELPARLRTMFHVEQSQTDPDAGIVVGQMAGGNHW